MHLISLEAVSKGYPEKPVLDRVSLGISAGERIGVIGRNGSGKSTLLRIVAGLEEPDEGSLVVAAGLRVAALDQDPVFPEAATLAELTAGHRDTIAMFDRVGLGDLDRDVTSLSGGQRKRAALALVLAREVDLLVLDEPTNHLDIDVIDWLEDHLASRRTAVLLVTHDRYLLDRVVTRIVEVGDRTLYPHRGGYAHYLEAKASREEAAAAAEQRVRQRLRTELEWLRRSPKARTSKARYRIKQVHELMAAKRREVPDDLVFDLPARRMGSKVVNLQGAGKRYGNHWVIRGVRLQLDRMSRVGVVGPNGAGKTTLLGLVAGRLESDEGRAELGTTVVPGWYGQDPRPLSPDRRVIDAVRDVAEMTREESGLAISAAKLLERFQFPSQIQSTPVGELSGGERRRLELLLVLMEAPNLLILDEPTNDLDIETLEALEEYLDSWPGALVVASHDRYFLDRVCDDLYSIENDGSVRHHPGGWSSYWADRQEEAGPPGSGGAKKAQESPTAVRKKLSYLDQREFDALDRRLPELERRVEELEAELEFVGDDYERALVLAADLEAVASELDEAETRWLELSAKLE